MTFRTLIQNSLRFHWRSHLGVVLGAAIGSAALIGALVVGDSVRESLRQQAVQRLGSVHFALASGDRLFRSELAGDFQNLYTNVYSGFSGGSFAPALQFLATAGRTDGAARANQVNLFGVDANWQAMGGDSRLANAPTNGVWLNEALAAHLNVSAGDSVLLRLPKPTALSQEASIAQRDDQNIVIRTEVLGVISGAALGNFSLRAGQAASFNAFMNLRTLQNAAGVVGRANLLLVSNWAVDLSQLDLPPARSAGTGAGAKTEIPAGKQSAEMHSALLLELLNCPQDLWHVFKLDDFQLQLRTGVASTIELTTPRIFLDSPAVRAAITQQTNAQPLVTYLANLLRAGPNATPYSMVTAAGTPWTPENLRDDEIVVSQWLADDLRVQPGDEIAVSYFLPESGAKLEEATNTFRVHSIVPLELPWADRTLMPEFPGIEKAESTSDWDAGFPLTYEIRTKDDDYWKQYRGTPKAFITLAAGQKMWGNRFGEATAIRFPVGYTTNSIPPATPHVLAYKNSLEQSILANLKPEELGLRFEPVRDQALKGAAESQDFGGLFLGFSFFLIIAALLLMAMLFQFGLEQRAPEVGTLLALGFTPGQVRQTLIGEGVALAFGGGVIGVITGIYFAKGMLHGLATIWRDAVGATALNFHVTGPTLVIGLFASVVVSTVTIWLALRKFVKRPARELLVGEIHADQTKAQSAKQKIAALAALLTAVILVGWAVVSGETANAGIFFGAGALVLIAGLNFVSASLIRLEREAPASRDGQKPAAQERRTAITTVSLAVRGCARRRKRSLATMTMLACGSFLIVSIGVFRLDANRDATQKTSGTGGFALIGETTVAVVQDLNTASGRDFFALNERDLAGVNFVPFRVRAGDEASCLNLNRAQKPRLLGVKPEALEGRFSFAKGEAWAKLESEIQNPKSEMEIPAIGDANSIQWAMGKKVGDTIDYVDERGQPFQVRIVGAVANSILQGQLIIDEGEFVKRFPGEAGYRTFLIDAPSNSVAQVSAMLSRALQDVGLELTPTAVRLNQFNAVQNTYLGTFQVLGGLGLLLGSVGLGIVVLRNVLERRSELAVLLAVGFRKAQVQRLLILENGALLLAGLALGVLAAAIAVLPAVLAPTGQLPYASLAITLAAVLANGALWTWVATRFAVRGDLLAALRND
jgi:putative ABC transport system permease protein